MATPRLAALVSPEPDLDNGDVPMVSVLVGMKENLAAPPPRCNPGRVRGRFDGRHVFSAGCSHLRVVAAGHGDRYPQTLLTLMVMPAYTLLPARETLKSIPS